MKLSQIFKVRVVENPKIKFNTIQSTFDVIPEHSILSFVPSDGSKCYETYMIYQHKGSYRDFNNNSYIYCKTVKEYLERDNFQDNKIIIDRVSYFSLADEFKLDGDIDLDYVRLKLLFNGYENNKLTESELKEELKNLISIQKVKLKEELKNNKDL